MFAKSNTVKTIFKAAVAAAVVMASAFLTAGCPGSPPGSGGVRAPVPDLKREIFLINGLAETLSIVNPEAILSPGGDIGAEDYIDNGTVVDLTKTDIYNDVLIVGKWPNHIFHYDDKLYITSSGENVIEVFDESTFAWEGEIDLGPGSNPWMVVRAGDTPFGYIPNFVAGDVAVVNLNNYTVVKRLPAGRGPEGAVYINGKVFVCNTAWDQEIFGFGRGTVTVIDTASETVEDTVDVEEGPGGEGGYEEGKGCNPQSAIAFPSLDEVHVICTGTNGGDDSDDGEIVVINADPSSPGYLDIKQRVFIGGSPTGGPGSVDEGRNLVYLTGVGGLQSYDYGDGTAGSLTAVRDSSDYIIVGDDPGSDFYSGVVYEPETDIIFVTLFTDDEVISLSAETYSELARFSSSDGVQLPVLVVE
jgi:hypothetical protein